MNEVLTFFIGLSTLFVLFATCVIYFHLLKTEHESLRLTLFDKRYGIYKGLNDWLIELTKIPEVLPMVPIDKEIILFLFKNNSEIRDFIDEVIKRYLELEDLNKKIKGEAARKNNKEELWYSKKEYNALTIERHELFLWLRAQSGVLYTLLEKYLDFRNVEPGFTFKDLFKGLNSRKPSESE